MKTKFEEGDIVIRIASDFGDTVQGKIYTVVRTLRNVSIKLVGIEGNYAPQSFKLFRSEETSSINTEDD